MTDQDTAPANPNSPESYTSNGFALFKADRGRGRWETMAVNPHQITVIEPAPEGIAMGWQRIHLSDGRQVYSSLSLTQVCEVLRLARDQQRQPATMTVQAMDASSAFKWVKPEN